MIIVYVTIAVVVLLAIVIIVRRYLRPVKSSAVNILPLNPALDMVFDSTPDLPTGFGYKCQWYAIRGTDTEAVADAFSLVDRENANWQTGIDGAYKGFYFVTPPVLGWTLVINALMPDLSVQGEHGPLDVLRRVSTQFPEVCYFGTHRIVEYHAWARACNGEIIRAYGYLGETHEILIDTGLPGEDEILHGLHYPDNELEDRQPDEDAVLCAAELWTISPLMNAEDYQTGCGIAGRSNV